VERVPAGALFSPLELVLNIYDAGDLHLLDKVLACLQLVEDDYIGGHGSRGSGQVAFENLSVICRNTKSYTDEQTFMGEFPDLAALVAQRRALQNWSTEALDLDGGA